MLGRKPDERRRQYVRTYEIKGKGLKQAFMDQLDACKDDESRRILLGVTQQRELEP
jgi:hypothetical protein